VVAATRRLAGVRQGRAVQRKVRSDQLAGHVVVYGLSQIGRRAAEELLRLDQTVVAVERPDRHDPTAVEHGLAVMTADLRQESGMAAVGLSSAQALILAADDDMGNLQVALAAARRYAGLRVVIRMFRAELGRHVQRELPNIITLSNSRLVAPRFVGAALRHDWEQRVQVRGYELIPLRAGTPTDGLTLPGPDGGPIALRPQPPPERAKPSRLWTGAAGRVLRDMAADRRLHVVLAIIVLVILTSTIVFRLGTPGLSWFAALYSAVTEIATTGLDPKIAAAPPAVRGYAVILLFAAALLLAAVYALFTDVLVSARLFRALGGVPRRTRDHVVVCGLGAVGLRIAERVVRAGLPVAAVQLHADNPLLLSARRQGISVVVGDARFPSTLREAQCHRARAVVLATRDDLTNLEAGLMVRREFPAARVVIRMYDQELARRAQELIPEAAVLSTAALAGPSFAAAALGPRVRGTIEQANRLYAVAETTVQPATSADGSTVGQLESGGRLRMLGIARDKAVTWRPQDVTRVKAGDTLIAVTVSGGLDDLVRLTRTDTEPLPVEVEAERERPGASGEPALPLDLLRADELDPD
jgi:Trk K+ transport system NAD-binding subunit